MRATVETAPGMLSSGWTQHGQATLSSGDLVRDGRPVWLLRLTALDPGDSPASFQIKGFALGYLNADKTYRRDVARLRRQISEMERRIKALGRALADLGLTGWVADLDAVLDAGRAAHEDEAGGRDG